MSFYLTTAINYTNGSPHIGHCFEAILADFISRYKRLLLGPNSVFFQTGTDEHGIKIAKTAESKKITPIELCDFYVKEFQNINKQLDISYNYFIRTTDPNHKNLVQQLFIQLQNKGDIYLDQYHGWYNVREETFITDHEAKQSNYLDTISGQPLTEIQEPSYFFRLSKYHQQIKDFISSEPSPIIPESKRNDILIRLNSQSLHDLSISRTSFNWGIPVPNDSEHYMYVWLDALFNYYTGPIITNNKQFWPPNCQIIGKDIIWFHAVIWPALLMASGLELPKQIYVHNFITDENGHKMSKSLGNVVDIPYLLKTYPSTTLRFYLLRECNVDNDIKFSEDRLKINHNSELADKFGNLLNRILVISEKTSQSLVPSQPAIELFDIKSNLNKITELLNRYHIAEIVFTIQELIHHMNQHLNQHTIWTIDNPKYPNDKRTKDMQLQLTRGYLEGLYIIACLWEPIQPEIAKEICISLNTPLISTSLHDLSWNNLKPNTSIIKGGKILFPKYKI